MTELTPSVALLTLFGEQDVRPTRRAVQRIAERLPFNGRQVADITLAVAEACVNGVRYSNNRPGEPVVVVMTEPFEDHLSIEVEDHGEGFALHAPAMPEPTAESGRGIALMHALMDHVSITSTHAGTRVRMIKYFDR